MLIRSLQNPFLFNAEGGGSTPPANTEPQTFSLEYVRELRAENKSYRLKAGDLEKTASEAKSAADKAAADLAALSAKATKDVADAVTATNTAAAQRLIRAEVKAGAVAAGIGHADFIKLLDTSAVTVDKDGDVVVPADFWTKTKAAYPHLFSATGADKGTTSQTAPPPKPAPTGNKSAKDMTPAEYKIARERIAKGIID